jgi:glycosyltransferase involved in cell wall biosynthesis
MVPGFLPSERRVRILFLSHYFPPEVNAPAIRTHEHARRWVADGHEVTVITGVPNHPRGELHPGYENRWLQEEQVDGIRVLRTWMYLTANEGFVRRTGNYVLFMLTAILASFRAGRPDVVVATSPQFFCGLAGWAVARLKRRPFVLEVRDLWPDSIVQLGQLRQPLLIRLLEGLETRLYRAARGIVVNTRAFRRHIEGRGIAPERIALVYNGIDRELFRPRPPDPELRKQHGLEGRFAVAYMGTLGLAHGLVTVLEAAERLRDRPEVVLLLIGDGAERDKLEREIRERKLENVRLLGLRPRAEMPAWIATVDLLLVMLRDLPVFATVIPSKIFEFLGQERPVVLAAPPGEIRGLVEEAGAALVIEPERADALADAIRAAIDEPARAAAVASAGRRWVEAEFVRDVQARRMADFLQQMAGAGRPGGGRAEGSKA